MLASFPLEQVPFHCQTHDLTIEDFDGRLSTLVPALRLDEPELVDNHQPDERDETIGTPKQKARLRRQSISPYLYQIQRTQTQYACQSQ